MEKPNLSTADCSVAWAESCRTITLLMPSARRQLERERNAATPANGRQPELLLGVDKLVQQGDHDSAYTEAHSLRS